MTVTEEDILRRANEVFSAMEKRSTLEEMQMIRKAFDFAYTMHRDQTRKTGEPYIIHPIAVAKIAASELKLGAAPVCAAFLHDVVEDTPCTNEKIREMFGEDVAFLVRIVTKQKNWKFDMSDIEERKYWNRYQKVYGEVLTATSTKYAPWYIVPADDKWYTRYVVAQIVLKALKAIDPKFPKLSPEVEKQLTQFRQLLKEVDIKDLKTIKNVIDEQKVK